MNETINARRAAVLAAISIALVIRPAFAQAVDDDSSAPASDRPAASPSDAPAHDSADRSVGALPPAGAGAPTAGTMSAPRAPTAPPRPPPGVASVGCELSNTGLDPASAATGHALVCDEIRALGVALAPAGRAVGESYRVSFERLGSTLIVRVSYEAPLGKIVRTRRVMLSGPEQLTFAASRLARAIVLDEPIDESQRMHNLVAEETRRHEKKPGEFLWGLGVMGTSAPGDGIWMAPGLELMGYYETPRYGFGFSLRTAFGSNDEGLDYASAGVGGRFFFSDADTSAFLGAGLAISGIETYEQRHFESHAEGSGLGAFAELGVEFMRLHSSRMILGLRADVPFYQLESYEWSDYGSSSSDKRWTMPVTVSATYAW